MSLKHVASGKVRDIYELDDSHLLFVTSDRMSAFDVVMAEPIPDKGRVLTAITAFWLDQLAEVAPHHLVSLDSPTRRRRRAADRPGRAGPWSCARPRCCRSSASCAATCPARRGPSTGESQTMHGQPCRPGCASPTGCPSRCSPRRPRPPTGHDENISFDAAVDLVGPELAEEARRISLAAYRQGAELAAERGIIIADTKFELGLIDGAAGHLRRGADPGLVPLLAGRPMGAGQDAAVVRQAAAAGLAGSDGLGQDAAAAGSARPRWSRPPGRATSRPTSG